VHDGVADGIHPFDLVISTPTLANPITHAPGRQETLWLRSVSAGLVAQLERPEFELYLLAQLGLLADFFVLVVVWRETWSSHITNWN
jgi:hypothetical protein